ncbi:hypothetical protein QE152_g22370 [Popillia japonica]|uniref:Uncharacterized protein n=1 Tax=Popillia japonica TaxID=7064 RepID=A0AAW1KKJ5_POPJA
MSNWNTFDIFRRKFGFTLPPPVWTIYESKYFPILNTLPPPVWTIYESRHLHHLRFEELVTVPQIRLVYRLKARKDIQYCPKHHSLNWTHKTRPACECAEYKLRFFFT